LIFLAGRTNSIELSLCHSLIRSELHSATEESVFGKIFIKYIVQEANNNFLPRQDQILLSMAT